MQEENHKTILPILKKLPILSHATIKLNLYSSYLKIYLTSKMLEYKKSLKRCKDQEKL